MAVVRDGYILAEDVSWLYVQPGDTVLWNEHESNEIIEVKHHHQDGIWYVAWCLGYDGNCMGWWPSTRESYRLNVGGVAYAEADAFDIDVWRPVKNGPSDP